MNNSLAKKRPELAREWSIKNAPVTPEQVSFGSNKRYWWKGSCGHEWQASVKARSYGEKCPICTNTRIVAGINDLATLHPRLAEEWSPINSVPASAVAPGSHKKVFWRGKCGHEWSASIRSRVSGAGCPYCAHHTVLPGFNDLATMFPKVAKEWSPRNLPLKPSQVTAYSNKKVWWRCHEGHEWHTLISTRSYGSQCPYCSGIRLLKGFNDLATLYPGLSEEWSERNDSVKPDMVNERSTKNVWWNCKTCGHEWRAVVKSRVRGLRCPVCAERAVRAGYNDLKTTDPKLAEEWDYEKNGTVLPTEVSRYSAKSVWWKGKCGHSWKDKISHRAVESAGCIYCESEFRYAIPKLLVMYYAGSKGLKAEVGDMKAIGVPLDAYVPGIKLAFAFPFKGTKREKDELTVVKYLCEKRGITYEVVSQKAPEDLCEAIKRGFAKVHVFIGSDSASDLTVVRNKFAQMRVNSGNEKYAASTGKACECVDM